MVVPPTAHSDGLSVTALVRDRRHEGPGTRRFTRPFVNPCLLARLFVGDLLGSPRLVASGLFFPASSLALVNATGHFVAEQDAVTVDRADPLDTGQAELGNFARGLYAVHVEVHNELLVVLTSATFDGVGVSLASGLSGGRWFLFGCGRLGQDQCGGLTGFLTLA